MGGLDLTPTAGFPQPRTRALADGRGARRGRDTVSVKGIRKPRRGRILLAYDGTPSARRALAARRARSIASGDEVGVIHVIEPARTTTGTLEEAHAAR